MKNVWDLLGFETYDQLKAGNRSWLDEALKDGGSVRGAKWSDSIAVGSEEFVDKMKDNLRIRARGRKIREIELRESEATYDGQFEAKKANIGPENTYFRNDYPEMLGI